jgi:hypothetical protein
VRCECEAASWRLPLRFDSAQRLGRADDRDVLKGLEREQIEIAGDDKLGARGERAGEHVIVIRIRVRSAPRAPSRGLACLAGSRR